MDTTEPRTAATLASHICDGESHRSKSKYQLDAKIDMRHQRYHIRGCRSVPTGREFKHASSMEL